MAKVILKQWDGGITQNDRPETINNQSKSLGFDIFKNKHRLVKMQATELETVSGGSSVTGEACITDAVQRNTDGLIIGAGFTSSSSYAFRFWRKNSDITGYWQQNSSSGSNLANFRAYCNLYKAVFYGFYSSTSEARLYRYDSDSAHTLIGTIADYSNNAPKPVVHSQDNILYMVANKTVAKYDGTTFTASAFTLPYECYSMCEYGTYVAFLCKTPLGSVIYLWGRDTSITTLQEVIQVDSGNGMILANLDGRLVTVSSLPYFPSGLGIGTQIGLGKMVVRMLNGGVMEKIVEYELPFNEGGTNESVHNNYFFKDGTLYFSTRANGLWRFGKNEDGKYVLSKDHQATYSTRNMISFYGAWSIGDYIWVCHRADTGSPADGNLTRTNQNGLYVNTAYYETTINPSMPLEDRIKNKVLTKIAVKIQSQAGGNGTVTIKYAFDNASYSTAIAETNIASKYVTFEATEQTDSSPFLSGRDLKLRIEATYLVDIIEVFYEYEIIETLI